MRIMLRLSQETEGAFLVRSEGMMDTEHTPLPWIQIAGDMLDEGCILITTNQRIENDKVPIATVEIDFSQPMNSEQIANAALIVHSVNLLPELVEALREADRPIIGLVNRTAAEVEDIMRGRIRALLAKATS